MRQHKKSKDPKVIRTLEMIRRTASREPMPRPCRFESKKAYSRKRLPSIRQEMAW